MNRTSAELRANDIMQIAALAGRAYLLYMALTGQVDTPPTRKLNRRSVDILFNVFNGNFIPPGCGLVRIFDLREVEWCGFSACVERIGADFLSAWCGLVRTGADFCYWLVRLVDSRATLCSLDRRYIPTAPLQSNGFHVLNTFTNL